EEWEEMNHPEDLPHSSKMLMDYVEGKIPKYQCETRMRHKNGSYVWTRDVGRIFERDENGKAVRVIGGHLNIDALKRSEERFIETLAELEHHKEYLEKEIDNRTKTLTEQDKMLWAVNDISRKLFSIEDLESIYEVIQECVRHYCNASGKDRISLWKNNTIDGQSYCSLLCEYSTDDKLNFSSVDFEKLFNKENIENILQKTGREKITEEILSRLKSASSGTIPYGEYFPTLYTRFMEGKSLNSLVSQLTKFEGFHLHLQGVKSFLVTPIILNNEVWGFIDAYNCQSEELFSEVEERMLSIVGFFLANTIQKNESEKKMREAEERIQLMLDATPLCCNLWTRDFKNMSCNEEAARLFELPSQQDYLDRFSELSPKYQPCGRLTSEMIKEYVTKAFEEGFCKFQWMHQKLDGTPIPAEVTCVRIKYKGGYIVAGYTRDLRELNTMLAKLREKENDLRSAMEEALLSSKAKTNFLANMSHEIRTPMNAISGFAEIILRESRDKQSAEYAVGIKNACGSLLNIINDILDISKIESGKLEIINSQ
ncbi:MAG: histidine kinase dimerization/phospho-acceptor domain-containing protein, partial [Anaerotignaceae bacterium]